MTKVRILTSVAGADIAWSAGEIVDMPEEQAAVWADGVRAERVARRPAESATVTPPEAAVPARRENTMASAPEDRAARRPRRRR